jgi:hypothetical protein
VTSCSATKYRNNMESWPPILARFLYTYSLLALAAAFARDAYHASWLERRAAPASYPATKPQRCIYLNLPCCRTLTLELLGFSPLHLPPPRSTRSKGGRRRREHRQSRLQSRRIYSRSARDDLLPYRHFPTSLPLHVALWRA